MLFPRILQRKNASIVVFILFLGYLLILWYFKDIRQGSTVFHVKNRDYVKSPTTKQGENIADLGSARISIFRQSFLKWHQDDLPLIDGNVDPSKYFIYRCDSGSMRRCGGWGDRAKGMITAYLIANLTGRVFKIEMLSPDCNLPNFVAPNLVNWSLPHSFHSDLAKVPPDTKIFDFVEDRTFLKDIYKINFTEMIGGDEVKYVYFKSNFDHTNGLMNTTVYRHELSWMKDLKHAQVLAPLFKHLFKLSDKMQSKMQDFLKDHLPSTQHKLICVHIRTGHLAISTDPVKVKFSDLPKVWTFVEEHSTNELHKVFVMSDSQKVIDESLKQTFRDRIVVTPGKISHLDKPRYATEKEECEAFEKVIFDQFLLMNCDVLMVSQSGLSRTAAHVRGMNEGLFRLTAEGTVRRSTTNSF